jgi:citrate lyase subunit beta/citryl-CoA lyase
MKKLRRSMLFLPGSSASMLSTAFIYKPDSIMFDLEDAVSLREKDSARILVFNALQHPMYKDIETVVRINPLNTPFGLKDLEAAVRAGVDVIRLPKQIRQKIFTSLNVKLCVLRKAVAVRLAPHR